MNVPQNQQPSQDLVPVVEWFSPTFLQAIHHHPKDLTIQYTVGRTFYVRWFDPPRSAEDTISVSTLVDEYMEEMTIPLEETHGNMSSSLSSTSTSRRQDGMNLHRMIECMFNGYSDLMDSTLPVHRQVCTYYDTQIRDKFIPWRSEMAIRSDTDLRLVGVVDMLFMKQQQQPSETTTLELYLKDWKYSRNIDSCKNWYDMQLNLYRFILESEYGNGDPFYVGTKKFTNLHIMSMELVVFHEDFPTCQIYPIECRDDMVTNVIEFRKKRMMEIKK
jgi:hypothetical protein